MSLGHWPCCFDPFNNAGERHHFHVSFKNADVPIIVGGMALLTHIGMDGYLESDYRPRFYRY